VATCIVVVVVKCMVEGQESEVAEGVKRWVEEVVPREFWQAGEVGLDYLAIEEELVQELEVPAVEAVVVVLRWED
jgi:hypothetical protein